MLRTRNVQPSLWESVLPEICLRLPAELERVDAWLDDERFFVPFRAYFDPRGVADNTKSPTLPGPVPPPVTKFAGGGGGVRGAGGPPRTPCGDGSGWAGGGVHAGGGMWRRRGAAARHEAQATVLRVTGELA